MEAGSSGTGPFISVITVVYNRENHIAASLQSVVDQTFKDFELVIIDGNSKDNTVAEARKFAAFTGTLISERDKGIFDAMNKGIAHAKGQWIYFLNAGDILFDNKVFEDLFSKPVPAGIELIYGKVQTINEPTGINYVSGEKIGMSDFYSRYPINHQSTFTHANAFRRLGGYDLRFPIAGDLEWFVRFFSADLTKALFVDRVIAFYDVIGNSYFKRMAGYREYLVFARKYFPAAVYLKNLFNYPFLWAKVKLIRLLTDTAVFKVYRKWKFSRKLAKNSHTDATHQTS